MVQKRELIKFRTDRVRRNFEDKKPSDLWP